ncbi:uncharacterized protein SPSK_08214 [Sporothrix schenckii 1099-18]|uniref:Uncharacterized protein n=1 Tax=Sporothrix schenckii 1099-18 TaxID=1397361 RepID=A0A0F2MFL0_SPOSC|nr:uncharacterized protein SPSK_08214 [Sporothrix schenckii 1099-18]KJR88468.1 hypothetical protein SPSK_08214 [Sporothrix schenckii 1099-18]
MAKLHTSRALSVPPKQHKPDEPYETVPVVAHRGKKGQLQTLGSHHEKSQTPQMQAGRLVKASKNRGDNSLLHFLPL